MSFTILLDDDSSPVSGITRNRICVSYVTWSFGYDAKEALDDSKLASRFGTLMSLIGDNGGTAYNSDIQMQAMSDKSA